MKNLCMYGGRVTLGLIALTLTGCSVASDGATSDEAPQIEQQDDGLLHCGYERLLGANGQTFEHEIIFSHGELNAALAKNGLGKRLGFERVETCQQASLATLELEQLTAALPEEADSNADPTEVDPTAKSDKPSRVELNEQLGTARQPIMGGAGYASIPALEINIAGAKGTSTCTGALINQRVAITAAHCVDHILNPASTEHETKRGVAVQLSLFRPLPYPPQGDSLGDIAQRLVYEWLGGGEWSCISFWGGAGKCEAWGKANITMHGAFTGSSNASNDIAIIWLDEGAAFPGVTNSDLLRVYAGSLDNVFLYQYAGRGPNKNDNTGAGSMRYGNFIVDEFTSATFTSNIRWGTRVCSGDSGGPATLFNCSKANPESCGNHMLGLLSNGTLPDNKLDVCAPTTGVVHGTRLNSKLYWVKQQTGISCSTMVGTVGAYKRCF